MTRFRIQVEGLRDLKKKLKAEEAFAEPLRAAYAEAAAIGEEEAKRRAPRLTGKTLAAIYSSVDKKPVPKWGAVRTRTVNRASKKTGKKFRYAWALNYSKSRYRYRSSGSGPTYDWFTGAIRSIKDRISGILTNAAREIEKQWQT